MTHDPATPSVATLILGAGQLGMAVVQNLAPRLRDPSSLTVLVAPAFVDTPNETEGASLRILERLGVKIVGFDLAQASPADLAETFSGFDTLINCTGFVAGPGTQLKITRAVLAAGVDRYFPWQFGVDYDVVGKGSGQPVFDEQYEVRALLRAQTETEWVIVSTGMFTSFLFEPAFDVVRLKEAVVRGLGGWDTRVTVTTPEDIGRLTTEIVLHEPRIANQVVFVASDTLSYGDLSDIVERVTGRAVAREALSMERLQADLADHPQDVMARYRVAFARGDGMWWDKADTYNVRNGIPTTDTETWLRSHIDALPET